MRDLKASFAPVADARTRLLVLGSLPGEVSLAKAEYYGHKQNHFWRLIGRVVERPLSDLAYDERLEALLAAGVGLWDVIRSAAREGSLDARIRAPVPHRLAEFAGSLPSLKAIGFNGRTAWSIGTRALGEVPGVALVKLPSSSPANARLSFAEKAAVWDELRGFL